MQSSHYYSAFRMLLGIYLLWHFAHLIPASTHIWSSEGIITDPKVFDTYGYFPGILYWLDAPQQIKWILGMAIGLSVALITGIYRRWTSALLLIIWISLYTRNPLIANPSLPVVGWILLCFIAIDHGEPYSLYPKPKPDWQYPPILFKLSWLMMGISYSAAGYGKLLSATWVSGDALYHIISFMYARDSAFVDIIRNLPPFFLKIGTWVALGAQVLFLPAIFYRPTRKIFWCVVLMMHITTLFILDFADISLGMILLNLFTFDQRWIQKNAATR